MLARNPLTALHRPPATQPKEKPRRLNRDRRRHLVETIAALIRKGIEDGQPSKFWCEGSSRQAIRSSLCLKGWKWSDADAVAAEVVTAALNQTGARRPIWAEGQPDWVQNGAGAHIPRTLCVRCGTRLPEGHHKFCSDLCGGAHHMAIARVNDPDRVNGVWNAWQARWSAKQPDRICEGCGGSYRPRRPKQKYCRPECVYLRCDEARNDHAKA